MNLIGKVVLHKVFGAGIVLAQDDTSITVDFTAKTATFTYPKSNTFPDYLQAEDPAIQADILQEIADTKVADEAHKRAEEDAKLYVDEERRHTEGEQAAKFSTRRSSTSSASRQKKAAVKQERIPGKRMIFFVFQNKTYDRASKRGYIWAPISEEKIMHHWERLLEVRAGDVILHGCDGEIKAISKAKEECYDCIQPEPDEEGIWGKEGRRIDCEYIPIKHPIKTAEFKKDILDYGVAKYSPFNRDGTGNQGYLFEISRELARIFIRYTVKYNDYLNDVDYIRELLAESNDD
ncbi:MAG TPA: hypothetical protein VN446_03110 [Candidatus Acidoferrum sp.]|nr:hypothetical protein [Candidatus Acidoferrum sp.]